MIAGRSPIIRQAVEAAGPLAVVVAIFLLFAGHNRPGGGFAAGLVLGAVVALRTVAGVRRLRRPVLLIGTGGLLAGLVALAPVLGGDAPLDQAILEFTVPILGQIKTGTALLFDVGVTLIVLGLVVAVIDGLGAGDLSRDTAAPTETGPS